MNAEAEKRDNQIAERELIEAITRGIVSTIDQMQVPEFPAGSVPVPVAAKVYGVDAQWVRAGVIAGWLPIGIATRDGKQVTDIKQMDSRYGKINYNISPKKLWEATGYIWKGERSAKEVTI